MSAEHRRLLLTLLLSLLMHTLLLSLTFGGQSFGLPGLSFPWRERRAEAPDLRVLLMPARATTPEPTVAGRQAPTPSVSYAPTLPRQTEAIALKRESGATPTEQTAPAPDAVPAPLSVPEVIAVERSADATFAVPPASPVPPDAAEDAQKRAVEVAKLDPPKPEGQLQRQADQVEAARVEAAKLETARQEATRVEAAKLEAARLETHRQEAVRLAAAKLEAQRQEIVRQEAARVDAAKLEAARIEAARLETQRQEAMRLASAKLEAQRPETARQEAVRQATAQKEAARVLAEKEEDERRAARREAMGRVLNEEAAKRDAAATATRSPSTLPNSLPYSLSTARRGRLLGRFDANAELVLYAEAWARKMQFNTSADTVRDVAKRPHTNPMVTVAIRSDGSVESVTFVVSSGVAEVDEAIRRIVQSQVPYQRFPPGLAREFDVIEVRRTWHFDTAVRLY